MNFLITLEAARVNAGYSMQDASLLFGVHHQTLSSYEKDSSKVPFSFVDKVPQVYKVPNANIFFGNKYEFIRTLRNEGINQEVQS